VAGWGKIVTGAIIGVAGTIYATNEEARKNLPKAARDLPVSVQRRFQRAVAAAREASSTRREEILRELEDHGGGDHASRGIQPAGPDGIIAPSIAPIQTARKTPVAPAKEEV